MKKYISIVLTFCMVLSLIVFVSKDGTKADAAAYNINGGTQTSATFIIDPGHMGASGGDPGACALGRQEADDVLDMALKVGRIIINSGYSVSFTRVTSMAQSLSAKCAQANNGSFSYFVSIHRNAGGGTGMETFYYTGSTASYNLAEAINTRVVNATGWKNRGLKSGNHLAVVNGTNMPACLLELGFIDTAADNTIFVNYNDAIANAIADGMLSMVGGSANSSGWQQINGSWCYKKSDGSWATGWLNDNGTWYYFDASGWMMTGWVKDGDYWYYLEDNGAMAIGWKQLGGVWYYLEENGAMAIGWELIGSDYYYFNTSGAMVTGWQTIDGAKYYFNTSGQMMKSWLLLDGVYYYLNDSGAMVTGWQTIGESKYYFNTSGQMQTGWQIIGSAKYYFNTSGNMMSGLQTIDGAEHYFDQNGALQVGWLNVNGEYTYFDESAGKQSSWQSFSDSSVAPLNRVAIGTSTDDLAQEFADVDWSLFNHNGEQITNATVIATGYVISFYDATGAVMESKTISVTGDPNGDGAITSADAITITTHISGSATLTNVYLEAADFDGSSYVSSSDFIALVKSITG